MGPNHYQEYYRVSQKNSAMLLDFYTTWLLGHPVHTRHLENNVNPNSNMTS